MSFAGEARTRAELEIHVVALAALEVGRGRRRGRPTARTPQRGTASGAGRAVVTDRQQQVDRFGKIVLRQVARDGVKKEDLAIGRQVECLAALLLTQQRHLERLHGLGWLRPHGLQGDKSLRVVLERAPLLEVAAPLRRIGTEAPVEAVPNAFVGLAVAAPTVDLEQLQVRQRRGAPRAAQV
ncbi:MAG: hypothetical protein MUC74_10515, partial [Ideonella sp.]|nr:hypothetical protein [Ideonella sp.]